jgi:hypothetical protein
VTTPNGHIETRWKADRPPNRKDSTRPAAAPKLPSGNQGAKLRPPTPSVARLDHARYLLHVSALPDFGGSVSEISGTVGSDSAPEPDVARRKVRNAERRFDKKIDRVTAEIWRFIQNPDWRPPPRWYCTSCGQLRSYEDRFCRLCGNQRPEEEPDGR